MKISVIIVAGGKGERMNSPTPKQYLLLNGKEVLEHVLDFWDKFSAVQEIILVLPPDDIAKKGSTLQQRYPSIKAVAPGGKERCDSVLSGLQEVSTEIEYVAVHDGVRPVLSEELVQRLLNQLPLEKCVIPVVPVKDTLKMVTVGGHVELTLDRERIRAVQTPQVFQRDLLENALAKNRYTDVTDEARLVEMMGEPVYCVPGDERNIKITTPYDLTLARIYMEEIVR